MSFPLRISSVNVTKSAENCVGSGHYKCFVGNDHPDSDFSWKIIFYSMTF